MSLPRISIIIPQLGREDGLKRCLESIKRSSYPESHIETLIIEGPESVPIKVEMGFKQSTGDFIIFAANDVEFHSNTIFNAIQDSNMWKKGLIAFDTGIRNEHGYICEHFMIKRELVEKIGGQIFDTDFHHCGVDDLLWAKCSKLNEAMVSTRARMIHNHFSRPKGNPMDPIYQKGWANVEADRALLKKKLAELNNNP